MALQLAELARQAQAEGSQRRQEQAEKWCEKGFRLLAQASQAGFADSGQLEKALEAFFRASQQMRRMVEPYVGISYILLLLGQAGEARHYLRQALIYNPDHQDAQRLYSFVQEQASTLQDSQAHELPTLGSLNSSHLNADDYDQLYDQVESEIQQKVHQLLSQTEPAQPTLKPALLERYRQTLTTLSEFYAQVQTQISIIDQEIETADLRAGLRPLEQMLKRYQVLCQLSEHFMHIYQHINSQLQQIESLQQQLQTTPEHSLALHESSLENFFDSCDKIADQLDNLDAEGHSIQVLEGPYAELLNKLETLRDALDDQAETETGKELP